MNLFPRKTFILYCETIYNYSLIDAEFVGGNITNDLHFKC